METLRLMLNAMGEDLYLAARPLERRQDPAHEADWRSRTPEERLRLASSWNRLAGRLAASGRAAKEKAEH